MGFDEGSIILDSENGAYYAGQSIYGRIVFDQGKDKTIHGIYVSVKGYCKVHWTSTETRRVNDRNEIHTINHDSYEEYFKNKRFVFGDASGEHHLQQGHHEFSFDSAIPNNCPSSFEGSHGHIRYRLKAVMVTSGLFSSNKEKIIPIKIHAPLDLNQNPRCREPIDLEIISSYCYFCMSAGSSMIKVGLPVTGYCGGQVMPLEVSVQNPSRVEIEELKFQIKQIVKYEAMSHPATKHENTKICELSKGSIPAGASRNWSMEMAVPAMDIYNLNACRFIDITYYFEVKSSLPTCHEDGEDSHLLIFGTVPLVGFQDNVQNPLQDQLPKSMQIPNPNDYPAAAIVTQPLPNSPYTNGNYPQNTPYPGGYPAPNASPYPNRAPPNVTPYPNNSPYPPAANSPYPPGPVPQSTPNPVLGFPDRNPSPVPPYPPNNTSYNGGLSAPNNVPGFPGRSPSPVPPYPGGNLSPVPPYPGGNPSPVPPYPGGNPTPPFPVSGPKTGNFGFVVAGDSDPSTIPLLPHGTIPYPPNIVTSPYVKASAPEPSTPDNDYKTSEFNTPTPAYNPEFMKNEK